MRATDNMNHPTGVVNIRILDAQGVEVSNETDYNLIVGCGYEILPLLLSGGGDHITKIAVGDDGTPPKATDKKITNKCVIDIDSATHPTPRSVRFNATINYSDAIGMSIRELGLYTQSDVLFSRKVREPIEKTQYMSIVVSWDINF